MILKVISAILYLFFSPTWQDIACNSPDVLTVNGVNTKSCMTHYNRSSAIAEAGDRLATIDMDRKVGGCCVPFLGGGAGSPNSVPSGILIYPTGLPRYTNVTNRQDRQDNGPVA